MKFSKGLLEKYVNPKKSIPVAEIRTSSPPGWCSKNFVTKQFFPYMVFLCSQGKKSYIKYKLAIQHEKMMI
jgi:hypothetical protein